MVILESHVSKQIVLRQLTLFFSLRSNRASHGRPHLFGPAFIAFVGGMKTIFGKELGMRWEMFVSNRIDVKRNHSVVLSNLTKFLIEIDDALVVFTSDGTWKLRRHRNVRDVRDDDYRVCFR